MANNSASSIPDPSTQPSIFDRLFKNCPAYQPDADTAWKALAALVVVAAVAVLGVTLSTVVAYKSFAAVVCVQKFIAAKVTAAYAVHVTAGIGAVAGIGLGGLAWVVYPH